MAKIKIDVFLRQSGNVLINKTYSGILQDNSIKYSDGIINIYNFEKNMLKRKTDEYEVVLDFENSRALYRNENMDFSLDLKVKNIKKYEDKVIVDYELEDNLFEYIINWRKV